MPDIQCLPSHVADLIAAGEVVERPASVAKELLENAIDAGSSAIVVEIQHGGLTYLRIADNGCGIDAEQLPTAFLRHATSKLRTAADLAAIGTLGFRGEALAAISAVSRVDIFSRRTGAETGASLHLEGGVPGQVEEVGCPEGTTICVRDLFYNTPARMKFMKKDSAEGAAVSGIVQHLALSHPEISFKLIRDGAELLHTPGDGDLQSAVYAAMGRDFTMGLLPISGCSGDISVEGFVTKPLAACRPGWNAASLLEQLPLLEEFGFVCEDFGDGTVLVRQVPSDLEVGDVPAALEELAEELRLNRADPAAARDSLLQTMACKSAIKAGMWSDPSELQALADKVQSGEIRYCPHGRPVAVKLSKYEMEKMFKRA